MPQFIPTKIFLDPSVEHLPKTQLLLKKLTGAPVEIVTDKSQIKFPTDHAQAKKQIYLTRHQGPALRPCQGMGNYLCCNYFTLSLVTGCPLDCSYCILQDFLQNNPVITVNTNIGQILTDLSDQVGQNPEKIFRLGPGELSDSLALDDLTEFSKDLVAFANDHPTVVMEIKTKTTNIQNLLNLKHNGNTVVSFSVNPQSLIDHEEYKCPSLTERLEAARKCADKGYPIGFHLDPILFTENWATLYDELITEIAQKFLSDDLAWFSMGTLRFTKDLKLITNERFPHSQVMTGELYPSNDGKIRTFRPLREKQYRHIKDRIQNALPRVPLYLCMETETVWKNVFCSAPANNQEIHEMLVKRWKTS